MSAAGEAGLSSSTSDFREPDPTSTIGKAGENGNSTCDRWQGTKKSKIILSKTLAQLLECWHLIEHIIYKTEQMVAKFIVQNCSIITF